MSTNTHVVVFYFSDESFDSCEIRNPKGDSFDCGDIIKINRDKNKMRDAAVILGSGDSEEEAARRANNYLQRLAKWDGAEGSSQLIIFGCDVSQLQFVQNLSQRYCNDELGFSLKNKKE